MILICLREADRDRRAACRLDEILRAALFQSPDQVDRLSKINDRGIGDGSAKAAGKSFPNGNLGANQEVLIRNTLRIRSYRSKAN